MSTTTIRQAVILAGGLGTRMQPYTLTLPKPMVPIHGKPFLSYIVEQLKENNIDEIIILTGYLHKAIENYFKDGKAYGLTIRYSLSPVEAETGTRLKNAFSLLDDTFLLLYGDNYWPLDLQQLVTFYNEKKKSLSVVVYENKDHYTKNNMEVATDGSIKKYEKNSQAAELNGVDIGYFIFKKSLLATITEKEFSIEKSILPKAIKDDDVVGFMTPHKYYGLSRPERIPLIEQFFRGEKTVFLDRDGVINKKAAKGEYIKNWDEFTFLPRTKEALQLLKKKDYHIYIVTNQPGIARKMVDTDALETIHTRLLAQCRDWEVPIQGIYVCPHGWDDGCWCRKPNPGLFFQASYDHAINLFKSYCIGDDPRDIIAAKQAGCYKSIYISEKENPMEDFEFEKPDFVVKDLYSAVQFL